MVVINPQTSTSHGLNSCHRLGCLLAFKWPTLNTTTLDEATNVEERAFAAVRNLEVPPVQAGDTDPKVCATRFDALARSRKARPLTWPETLL